MRFARIRAALLAVVLAALLAPPSAARAADRCLAVAGVPQRADIQPVSLRLAQVEAAEIRLTFVGHSTFLIESAEGIKIATDYNDYIRPAVIPDIATMNRAHNTHYSNFPDPGIRHVLPGWNPDGGPARHDVTLGDVRVRNVPTHIRGWDGGTTAYGNSIFVFEVADLCIAHLGHLHHTLNPTQLSQLGQMDVVLVPVDGSFTMDLDGMIDVLKAIRAPLMIPMHYFSRVTLDRFLTRIREAFEVRESGTGTIMLSRAMLPKTQEILVLPGREILMLPER